MTRALGSLEGTGKFLDPNFKVIESAYPFVIGRLLSDPNPDMRRILRQLLICNDGSIRWNRLECLMAATSEQASESTEEGADSDKYNTSPLGWKSFDMRAVVNATEDLLQFILSENGCRVRVFLLRDIIKAVDAFLQDEVVSCIPGEKPAAKETIDSEAQGVVMRVATGFSYLHQAIKLAPELWTTMLIRMALKPEFTDNVSSQLSPWASALFEFLPVFIRKELLLKPESDDSAQLSQIETEKLLAHLVEVEMNKRQVSKCPSGKV